MKKTAELHIEITGGGDSSNIDHLALYRRLTFMEGIELVRGDFSTGVILDVFPADVNVVQKQISGLAKGALKIKEIRMPEEIAQ